MQNRQDSKIYNRRTAHRDNKPNPYSGLPFLRLNVFIIFLTLFLWIVLITSILQHGLSLSSPLASVSAPISLPQQVSQCPQLRLPRDRFLQVPDTAPIPPGGNPTHGVTCSGFLKTIFRCIHMYCKLDFNSIQPTLKPKKET